MMFHVSLRADKPFGARHEEASNHLVRSRVERVTTCPENRDGSVLQPSTQSFIVKIWIEEQVDDSGSSWRGRITHVPSGEKRYVRKISEVALFIASYLRAMNVPIGIGWSLRHWIHKFRSRANKR